MSLLCILHYKPSLSSLVFEHQSANLADPDIIHDYNDQHHMNPQFLSLATEIPPGLSVSVWNG